MPDRRTLPAILTLIGALAAEAGILASALTPNPDYQLFWLAELPMVAKVGLVVCLASAAALIYLRSLRLAAVVSGSMVLMLALQPFLRGYASYGRADTTTYIGVIQDILETGTLWVDDIYPLLHLLIVEMSLVSGVPFRALLPIWAAMQYLLWLGVVWLGAQRWFGNTWRPDLALLLATIPIFTQYHFILFPNGYAIILLAMILVAWFESNDLVYRSILVMMLIVLPYAHPTVALITIVLVAVLVLTSRVLQSRGLRSTRLPASTYSLAAIPFVSALFWLLDFRQIQSMIKRSFGLLETRSEAQAKEVTGILLRTLPPLDELLTAVAVLIGASAILTLFALASLRATRASRIRLDKPFTTQLILIFVLLAGVTVSFLFVPILGEGVFFLRVLNLPYPLIVAGWGIAAWMPRPWIRSSLVPIFLLSLVLASAGIYRSPLTFQPNDQIDPQEFAMAAWLHEYAIEDRLVSRLHAEPWRLVDGSLGKEHSEHHGDTFEHTKFARGGIVPDHFGLPYPMSVHRGELGRLFTVTVFDQTVYTTVWATTDRFTAEDFTNVSKVFGNSKVYDAGPTMVLYS